MTNFAFVKKFLAIYSALLGSPGISIVFAIFYQKKGWKKSDNSPALNVDLWERLLPLLKYHEVEFVWVKGHAGHPENERCDRLAVEQSKKYGGRQQ